MYFFLLFSSRDLEEMTTALAFNLPASERSENTTTTSTSLISTVVVLDIAQNWFNCEGDQVNEGEK